MKFLISVDTQEGMTKAAIISLLENLTHQYYTNIVLVIYGSTERRKAIKSFIDQSDVPFPVFVVSPEMKINLTGDYVVTLLPGDRLLPGALFQWRALLEIHPSDLVIPTCFNHQRSIDQQLDAVFERELDVIKADTVATMVHRHVPIQQWHRQSKLGLLPAIQNYEAVDQSEIFETLQAVTSKTRLISDRKLFGDSSQLTAKYWYDHLIDLAKNVVKLQVPTLYI